MMMGFAGFMKEKGELGIYLLIVGYGLNNFRDNVMELIVLNDNSNYYLE